MAVTTIICAHCEQKADRATGEVNRANRRGLPLYCNRLCAGLGRRQWKPDAQKKEEKAVYDMLYRAKNQQMLRAKKAERFQRTYDPAKAAVERKKTMARHVEYCRQPEYRKYKQQYDRRYRAEQDFGEFAESFLVLQDINREIMTRTTRYEIDLENGKLGKAQRRKRQLARIVGSESQKHALGHPQPDQERRNASRSGRRHRGSGAGDSAHRQGPVADRRAVEALGSAGGNRVRGEGLSGVGQGGEPL